jgi:hypothetical protein
VVKGKFGLLYINEEGEVFPAYPKGEEERGMVDSLVKMGMFGENIIVDKDNQIGELKGE